MHVLIATRDREVLLARTLLSLAEAKRPAELAAVVVVENGSPGTTAKVCRNLGHHVPIHYHHLREPGVARALQFGLTTIGAGPVVFVDDDVRVGDDFLVAYAEAMNEVGRGAVYGGSIEVDYADEPPPTWLLPYLPYSAKGYDASNASFFLGANFGVYAEDALEVGGFNPELGAGATTPGGIELVGQEKDLQQKLFASGFDRVYLGRAKLWHWVPKDRCTPQWALDRIQRNAVTMEWMSKMSAGPKLFGVPRWMWRELTRKLFKRAWTSLSLQPERRFEGKAGLRHILGRMHGAQFAPPRRRVK